MKNIVNLKKPKVHDLQIHELKKVNGGNPAAIAAAAFGAVVLWIQAVEFAHEIGEEIGRNLVKAAKK